MALLSVKNLNISFGADAPDIVSDVSFEVERGEILALVGESGCGKSISCLSLTSLLPSPPARVRAGAIEFRTKEGVVDLTRISARKLRKIRGGGIAYIFQEPSVSLNPVFRVGSQIAEVLTLHRPDVTDIRGEVIELLRQVGIPAPESRIDAFPHEMSGGMQQRVMIAMALAGNPELLVADEPTTALDVTIQAQILELIDELRRVRNMAVILVTHNLGIVARLANRVAVMYAGNIVEYSSATELFAHPAHPYTRALLKAVPHLGGEEKRLSTIPGHVPSPEEFAPGCRFCDRCERRGSLTPEEKEHCRCRIPGPVRLSGAHTVYCHFPILDNPGEQE
ncbi:ABC transporter ATP-binding protein [uncultured Victivallis sp.]|uniref:ABC transporter ATP-binding protein n=1 Tax=uncultured Victivallis sp. TaxID=354118 RepID=UPI0025DE1D4D|nr:ABC transporter ATP-binding protein [uncultured Victivallis sp.]